jgi:predicted nucleic acid-binding protein
VGNLVVLDAGPLGLASKRPGKPDVDHCLDWMRELVAIGHTVAVPEIARYEVRRELVRVGATAGLIRLDRLQAKLLYLPLDSEVMDQACSMWAHVRNAGLPTAQNESLDGDAILAAQAWVATRGTKRVIIATTNVAHLARFPGIDARNWSDI